MKLSRKWWNWQRSPCPVCSSSHAHSLFQNQTQMRNPSPIIRAFGASSQAQEHRHGFIGAGGKDTGILGHRERNKPLKRPFSNRNPGLLLKEMFESEPGLLPAELHFNNSWLNLGMLEGIKNKTWSWTYPCIGKEISMMQLPSLTARFLILACTTWLFNQNETPHKHHKTKWDHVTNPKSCL